MTSQEIANAIDAQYVIIMRAQAYLAETDYKSIRQAEGGKEMDEKTRLDRAQARIDVDTARSEITKLQAIVPEEPEMNHDMDHIEPNMAE